MPDRNIPWYSEYKIFGLPKSFEPYPDDPVSSILDNTAKKFKKTGLIQFNKMLTYPEVKDHADRLATALYRMGLKKGDRVATILPTSIQFVISDYAISKAGLVHIPSSSLEPADTLKHKFKEGTPKVLICLVDYQNVVKDLIKGFKVDHIIFSNLHDYSTNPPEKRKKIGIDNVIWMTDLITDTPPEPPIIKYDTDKDLETLLFTGGTTGLPKGCMLTHKNIYANAIQNISAMGGITSLLKGSITILLGLPFSHSYGHNAMHAMTMNGYNQILIPDSRDTDSMVEMIKTYYPLIQIGVPAQFMSLQNNEKLKDIGMLGLSGSAPLPPTTQLEYEKKSGGGIMEAYGLSEMSPGTHMNTSLIIRLLGGRTFVRLNNLFLSIPGVCFVLNKFLRLLGPIRVGKISNKLMIMLVKRTQKKDKPMSREKRGTVGIPYPDTKVKILDVSTGKQIPWDEVVAGKTGEMCLNGPQRMLGYWPKLKTGFDKEGYIHTGDIVKVDENGYFYIVDRTKDMIIVSGYKVYSREVDDILHEHPKVEAAATIGIPNPEREGSEKVVVFIQPKPKARVTEKEIIDYLKARVAKYAVPKVVKIIKEMPRTAVEKVDKKILRKMALEKSKKNNEQLPVKEVPA